jgi:hypothetical protein
MNSTDKLDSLSLQNKFEADSPEMNYVFIKKQFGQNLSANSLMRVHFDYYQGLPHTPLPNQGVYAPAAWQFRQFELGPHHYSKTNLDPLGLMPALAVQPTTE